MPGQGRLIEKKESPGVGFWLREIGGASIVTAFYGALVIAFLVLATTVSAQDMPKDQPPLWSAKPDAAAFEKMENDRLAAAHAASDKTSGVCGAGQTKT